MMYFLRRRFAKKAQPLIYRIYAAGEAAGHQTGNMNIFRNKTNATISGSSNPRADEPRDWRLSSDLFKERRQSESTTAVAAKTIPPGLSRSLTWVRPKNHPSRVLKSVRSEWQPRWPEQTRRGLEGIPPSDFEGAECSTETSEGDGDQKAPGGESSECPKVSPNRYSLRIDWSLGVAQEDFFRSRYASGKDMLIPVHPS